MDATRFDAITRRLGNRLSRRDALQRTSVSVVAGLRALTPSRSVAVCVPEDAVGAVLAHGSIQWQRGVTYVSAHRSPMFPVWDTASG